jgi:hypothetical protein
MSKSGEQAMSALPVSGEVGQIPLAIHLEYIRNVADGAEGDGAEAVEAFHRSLFLNRFGAELERCRQERETCEQRLAHLESRLRQADDRLGAEEKFVAAFDDGVADDQPNQPWNAWSRTMFGVAAAAIVVLLVFGVFNVSFNLLESGIVTFSEHPIRAYFWAALLPVGALAVKVGWDQLRGPRWKAFYYWTCLGLGLGGVLLWVAAYASVYPSLSRTAAEQIGALNVFEDPGAAAVGFLSGTTAGGVKWVDMILVAAQAVAEIFVSAVLGIHMTQIYARHRPVRLAMNPTFAQFDAERSDLEARIGRERTALAVARGDQTRLENQLVVFVSYARSLLQRELAARRDRGQRRRVLIEEVAEQLKSRLEALDREDESNGHSVNGRASEPPALSKEAR